VKLFCLCPQGADLERVFSAMSIIHTARRNRLGQDKVAMVRVKSWRVERKQRKTQFKLKWTDDGSGSALAEEGEPEIDDDSQLPELDDDVIVIDDDQEGGAQDHTGDAQSAVGRARDEGHRQSQTQAQGSASSTVPVVRDLRLQDIVGDDIEAVFRDFLGTQAQ
jgi:hypothetical protein